MMGEEKRQRQFGMGGLGHGIGSAPASPYGNPYPSSGAGNQGANAAQQAAAAAAYNSLVAMTVVGLGLGSLSEPPLESAGITVGELVGWRIWRLENDYLKSYSADYGWLPGHPAQGEITDYGGGGIWAFKDPHRAHAKASGRLYVTGSAWYVTGSVWLWGEVIEHADGYRGEYAAIRSLDALTVPDTTGLVEWPWERARRQRAARREAQEMLTELRERYLLQPLLQGRFPDA